MRLTLLDGSELKKVSMRSQRKYGDLTTVSDLILFCLIPAYPGLLFLVLAGTQGLQEEE